MSNSLTTSPLPYRSGQSPLSVDFGREHTKYFPPALKQIALLGTCPPRQCGIATYTADVMASLQGACPEAVVFALAISKGDAVYNYPPDVALEIRDTDPASYREAARYLNHVRPDVLCVQHEYGIFGGEAGSHLFELLENCDVPVVTIMHTILADPSPEIRLATRRLLRASDRVVVMTRMAADLLHRVYGSGGMPMIDIIPHGIPDVPFRPASEMKGELNLTGKFVLLTFGLLSPGKGIEYAIEAMPAIVAEDPSATYVILGATHPCLIEQQGEAYRESLIEHARELGVEENIIFVNQYVDIDTLTKYIRAADVYLTPYLNEAQITSGTLAYASGAGCPVVSTPYYHAVDLITPDRGFVVPFRDSASIAEAVCQLIHDPSLRESMRANAWNAGRPSTWKEVGKCFAATCAAAAASAASRSEVRRAAGESTAGENGVLIFPFSPSRSHLKAMLTPNGIWQHAKWGTPDEAHGFCADDNARTLILAAGMWEIGDHSAEWDGIARDCFTFIEAAFNPGNGRFRNFADANGNWLEDAGSPDSHGRILWACGVVLASRRLGDLHERARMLLEAGLKELCGMPDLRPWAFAALGLASALTRNGPEDRGAWLPVLEMAMNRLVEAFRNCAREDWLWFEDHLTYDNAKLPHALIAAGAALKNADAVACGVEALTWLTKIQTARDGHFRPVGCRGWMNRGASEPARFDQQPLEAWATISACLAALGVTGDSAWAERARHAFLWFLGENDLGQAVYEMSSGGVFDGLQADGVNRNQGAESLLSFHLAHFELSLFGMHVRQAPASSAAARISAANQ